MYNIKLSSIRNTWDVNDNLSRRGLIESNMKTTKLMKINSNFIIFSFNFH